MEYEFKVGQKYRYTLGGTSTYEIIHIFEYEGVKFVTCRSHSILNKKYNFSTGLLSDFVECFNFGMIEIKEFEYLCVTCGKITKRENDVDTIIKCDNCDGQAMLRY
jgi:DNA-directed RNA polymerase subunit RPC12/RpoP